MAVRALAAEPAANHGAADPDAALVAAARQEPRRFLALYDRYFTRVLGYVRLRIRDQATCEDVTSQIFTTALERLPTFRGDGRFAGWLFQIARNAVADAYRRPRHVPLQPDAHSHAAAADEALLERERRSLLHAAIGELPPEQRHLLSLRYGAGLSSEEIGALVGAAPGTVRVRLHRTLEQLRRRYPNETE